MNRLFLRNFLFLVVVLLVCAAILGRLLIAGERNLNRTDDLVVHTYSVITRAEQLSTLVESMLAAQRGYILSAGSEFLKEYETKKAELSDLVADLSELSKDSPSQTSRISELRYHTVVFTDRLEERARQVEADAPQPLAPNSVENIDAINDARVNIRRINDALLSEEYGHLKDRIAAMEDKKRQYLNTLLTGGVVGTILILLFNGFLFQAQMRRARAEISLQDSEERFGLAIEGTNDGIFDWDIQSGKIFYSKQFFGMLGYHDRGAFTGIQDDARMLMHSDDVAAAMEYLNRYLQREIPEYSNTFRMRHSNGSWVWINSRGKAIFSIEGMPLRMVGAHTDITYLKASQERLQQEKDAAEQANRAKSDFLAHMSHEIRTPLTAISGIAEILDRTEGFDAKQRKLISTLGTSTSSLKDLISDILDFSKIESGELELSERSFLLDDLFEQVISMMMVRAHEKKLVFTFEYPALKQTYFYGDSARLRQILINLVGNALKFSDEGSVRVQAARINHGGQPLLEIKIVDTGIGISESKFDIIFERFKQADSSVSRKYGGTGLGLPISKNLAIMMGGDIRVESRPGQGSTFTLLVPFKGATEDVNHFSHSDHILREKISDQVKSSLSGRDRVLLVEDYEGNIVVIGYILDDLNLDYDIARTGVEALNLWKQKHYDAILMDVQMPEMDGLTACTCIRALEAENDLAPTPIIGMTAHALVADKDKCIAAGMDAYLSKPIVEAELKIQILKSISSSKNEEAA